MDAKKKAAIVNRAATISSKWAGPVYEAAKFDVSDYIESVIEHLQKEDADLAEIQEWSEVSYGFPPTRDQRAMVRKADEIEVGDNQNRQEILVDLAVLDRLLELIEEDE